MMTTIKTIWPLRMVLMGALLSSGAWAALPDPTRPPPGMTLNAGTGMGAGNGVVMGITAPPPPLSPRVTTPTPPAPPARPAVTPRVQALHHPIDAPPGSASALIDGRLLHTGDRVGDAVIQDIRPDGVWLRLSRGGTQWLGLFAPIEAPVAATASAPPNGTAPESATGTTPVRKEP